MKFDPFEKIKIRLTASKAESDVSYYFDLLLLGEFLTKMIALFLVSSINDDKQRTRYRYEHSLVRANAIGDFSKVIDEIITGPASQLLNSTLRDFEIKELSRRSTNGEWQYEAQVLLQECLEIFNIQSNKLGVKSPLRNWFSNFALLRNKTKGHGAPKVETCSLAARKLELSVNLIIDNYSAFKRSWAYLYRNLSGKYRVSAISEDISEFKYLTKENSHTFANGIFVLVDTPRQINLFYSNPELSDYWITNGNLKNDKFETISYITDDRTIRTATEYMQPITQLPKSHTEGKNELDVLGNVFTNLPKPPDLYVQRKELEDALYDTLILEDRFPIITLLGKGGVGKTSLALNYLEKFAKENKRFDIIIWFSARDIDLLMEGVKQVETNVLNVEDISKVYCSLMYPEKIIKNKVELFSKELGDNPLGKVLYIFDNFETITNPIEVFEWLNTYIRNPNKILITSRISRNFKADYPIEIFGMSEDECKKLIINTANSLNISNLITNNYIEELISESDGHPYIIKIILGEVARKRKLDKIKRIVGEQEEILASLFKRTFYTLSPVAKRVFLTLCSWNSMIPRIAIEAVLWRPENEKMDVSSAIEELRQSSFIDIFMQDNYEIINLPLAALIFGKSELEIYPEKIKILADRKLLMEFGTTSNTNVSSGIIRNIELKFKAISKRINSIDEFEKEIPILEYIASKYPKTYSFIIEVYEEYRVFDKVKYYLREYLKRPVHPSEKKELWLKLANVCKISNDWDGESHALIELSRLPETSFDVVSDCANRINNNFYYNVNAKKDEYKSDLLQNMIEIMASRIEKEGNATDFSRLGWLLMNNNQQTESLKIVKKGLEIDESNIYCLKLFSKLTK